MDTIKYMYNNESVVRAADFLTMGCSDSEAIERAMEHAQQFHIGTILIDQKDWLIDRAVEVPSNTTVIVDGVLLKQADEVLDNIFRPDGIEINPEDPNGFAVAVRSTENIRIVGKNGAVLEGPNKNRTIYHPVLQENQEALGDFWGWRGFLLFFPRCNGFEVSGFTIRQTRSWAISMERSKNGYLHDLQIYSTCKNGDGINIRLGCSEIVVENITAETSDDCIAINSFGSETRQYPFKNYVHTLHPSDYLIDNGEPIEERYIHDIHIRNITTSTNYYSQGVAFLARQGHKIFNIWINDVYDGNPIAPPKRIDMIGAYYAEGYGSGRSFENDLANIYIDGVVANSTDTALLFRHPVSNLQVTNITQNNPEGVVLTSLQQIPLPNCQAVSDRLWETAEGWSFKRW